MAASDGDENHFSLLFASERGMLLDSLRRLPLLKFSAAASLRSHSQRGTMGTALGAPKAAAAAEDEKRRCLTSSAPPIAAAETTTTKPSSSPSFSPSAPFRLLESPATDRALLPKRTPLGNALPPVIHAVLDAESETRAAKGRLVIVGDVHGCTEELRELLEKLSYGDPSEKNSDDLLIFVGDLVNKGPDSIGTLELAMASGGICVRGNHDEAAVALRRRIDEEEEDAVPTAALAAASLEEAQKKKKKREDKKRKEAKQSKPDPLPVSELLGHMPWVADPRASKGLRWLAGTPFSLRLESRGLTVVHAGLVPNSSDSPSDSVSSSSTSSSSAAPAAAATTAAATAVTSVESQRLGDLLEVRHVAKEFAPSAPSSPLPPSSREGNRWRAVDKKVAKAAVREGAHASGIRVSLWAKEYRAAGAATAKGGGEEKLSSSSPPPPPPPPPPAPAPRSAGHVVFGHHASLGLQQEPCATGIDTGCVLGGELTALVLGPVVLPSPPSGTGAADDKSKKTRRKVATSSSGWRSLPGGAELVSVKAERAYVGKDAADAGAEEC